MIFYRLELKTPNCNWKTTGIQSKTRPITKNIKSVIDDTKKLNSNQGIIAFVLFPIPNNDIRWTAYIDRISVETGIKVSSNQNCSLITINIDQENKCDLVVCAYMSKVFNTWF
jgi:hypothetical protein